MGCTVSTVVPNGTSNNTLPLKGGDGGVGVAADGQKKELSGVQPQTANAHKPAIAFAEVGGSVGANANNNGSNANNSGGGVGGTGNTPKKASPRKDANGNASTPDGSSPAAGSHSEQMIVVSDANGAHLLKPKKVITPRLQFPRGSQQKEDSSNSAMTSTVGNGTTASAAAQTFSASPGITPREDEFSGMSPSEIAELSNQAVLAAAHAAQLPGGVPPRSSGTTPAQRHPNPIVHTSHSVNTPPATASGAPATTTQPPALTATANATATAVSPPTGPDVTRATSNSTSSSNTGRPPLPSGSTPSPHSVIPLTGLVIDGSHHQHNMSTSVDQRAGTPGSASHINIQLRSPGASDSPALDPRLSAQRTSVTGGDSTTDSPASKLRKFNNKRSQTFGHYNESADKQAFDAASSTAAGSLPKLGIVAPSSNAGTGLSMPASAGANGSPPPNGTEHGNGPRRRSLPMIHQATAQTGGDIDFTPADIKKTGGGASGEAGLLGDNHPLSPTSLKGRYLAHKSHGQGFGVITRPESPELRTGGAPPPINPGYIATHAQINHPTSLRRTALSPSHGPVPAALSGGGSSDSSSNTSPLSASQPVMVYANVSSHAGVNGPNMKLNSGHAIGSAPINAATDAKSKRQSLDGTSSMRKSNRFGSGNVILPSGAVTATATAAAATAAAAAPTPIASASGAAAAGSLAIVTTGLVTAPTAAGIPATPASGGTSSRPHSRSMGRGRGRPLALVVDDVKVTQVVTSAAMYNAGYVSEVAADGLEAVAMAQNTHYEVILMDVALPKIDGVEATRRIRAFESEHGIAPALIFGLTATVNPVSLEKYRAAGMNACLEKGSVLKESVKVAIGLADRNGYFFINSRNQTVLNLSDVVETGAPSKTVPETTKEH